VDEKELAEAQAIERAKIVAVNGGSVVVEWPPGCPASRGAP